MLSRKGTKHLYLKLITKVRSFLLKVMSREFLIFLFFMVVATGFWLLQTLDNDYEMTLEMPVHLKNVPDDVVVTEEPVAKLQVKVKDRGSVLLNYMIGRRMKALALDFREYKGTDGVVAVPTIFFERDVQNRLNISTKIVDVQPDTLSYVFTLGECKRVPVIAVGDVKSARQYYMSDTVVAPDSVVVYAPKHILDTITVAATEMHELKELTESASLEVGIAHVSGAKFVPGVVKLTYQVDVYTEKTIEAPVVGVGFPPDMVLRTFPSTVKVTFMVGLDKFSLINPADFAVIIPYDEYLNNSGDKLNVSLVEWPEYVRNVRVSPDKVDFLIERKDTE